MIKNIKNYVGYKSFSRAVRLEEIDQSLKAYWSAGSHVKITQIVLLNLQNFNRICQAGTSVEI